MFFKNKLKQRKLKCRKLKNIRDLGYLSITPKNNRETEKITSPGVFIRSENPYQISKQDLAVLTSYGVKTIIDLRTESEIQKKENPFSKNPNFSYYHIDYIGDFLQIALSKEYGAASLADLYIGLLKNCSDKIRDLFSTIAEKIGDGGILFHCSMGKDRTGVTAALLLDLAGVEREEIVEDYAASCYCLKGYISRLNEFPTYHSDFLQSEPKEMEKMLDFLENIYGGTESYLLNIGVSSKEIETIKEKFIKNKF